MERNLRCFDMTKTVGKELSFELRKEILWFWLNVDEILYVVLV